MPIVFKKNSYYEKCELFKFLKSFGTMYGKFDLQNSKFFFKKKPIEKVIQEDFIIS